MASRPQFEVVTDEAPETRPAESGAATDLLVLALTALSKRFVVALASLFTLLTVASAFWLWHSVPDPTATQLVGLGMYGLLVLAINVIVRRG